MPDISVSYFSSLFLGLALSLSLTPISTNASTPLEGVYRGFGSYYSGGLKEGKAYYFSKNGGVWEGLCPSYIGENIEYLKDTELALFGIKRRGIYEIQKELIVFTWADGGTESSYFEKEPAKGYDNLKFFQRRWKKLVPFSGSLQNITYDASDKDGGFDIPIKGYTENEISLPFLGGGYLGVMPSFEVGYFEIKFNFSTDC